ncbi:MAG: hypothetical protein LUF33_00045 [Clostridiales bacterium]|nr:hypothetical protein [Clostridiales bacterium]
MSKIIDITDKLNFEEKPIIKVKDVKVTANNDAVTMLKVIAIFGDSGKSIEASDILKLYNLLFDKENQRKIDSLKLSMQDFSTLIIETAQGIISDEQPDEGEAQTPATT